MPEIDPYAEIDWSAADFNRWRGPSDFEFARTGIRAGRTGFIAGQRVGVMTFPHSR